MENQNIVAKTIGYYINKKGIMCIDRKFAVLNTSGNDLQMFVVAVKNNTTFETIATKNFARFGVAPLVRSIAEKIVNSVNMSTHMIPLSDTQQLNAEFVRHCELSAKVINYMEKNPGKDTLKLSTNFECKPENKYPVGISIPEVREMALNYARMYAKMFVNDFLPQSQMRVMDLDQIILVGDIFYQMGINQDFNKQCNNKITIYSSREEPEILAFELKSNIQEVEPVLKPLALHKNPDDEKIDPEATLFQVVEPVMEPVAPPKRKYLNTYIEVTSLNISNLQNGTWVKLETNDPTPGKGAAFQELAYVNGFFRVLDGNRTLLPGDIAKPKSNVWNCGVQIDMYITRDSRKIGTFRTRFVQRILVKNCYEDSLN